jgi:hypothetical protein
MDSSQRLALDRLIKEYNPEETTNDIRSLKHSKPIMEDVITLEKVKKDYSRLKKTNPEEFKKIAISRGNFLWTNYTNIYNRLMNDELDINILSQFISVLKKIEEGNIDQHEGSVYIGELLKKLYVDSALRHGEKVDKKEQNKKPKGPKKDISWKEYKLLKKMI